MMVNNCLQKKSRALFIQEARRSLRITIRGGIVSGVSNETQGMHQSLDKHYIVYFIHPVQRQYVTSVMHKCIAIAWFSTLLRRA